MELTNTSPQHLKVGTLNKTYVKRAEAIKAEISQILSSQSKNGLISRDIFYQTLK